MGEMNEVNGLLILAGIGVKRRGLGVAERMTARSGKKIPHSIKVKKGMVK